MAYVWTYEYIGTNHIYRKRKSSEFYYNSFYIIKENHLPLNRYMAGGNIFKCNNGRIISIYFLCDGENDCSKVNSSDEIYCRCNNNELFNFKCKYQLVSRLSNENLLNRCSFYYLDTYKNSCIKYKMLTSKAKDSIIETEIDIDALMLSCSEKHTSFRYSITDICSFAIGEK